VGKHNVDFITQLPKTVKGHTAIITFVDRLTKMTHLVPTATTVGGKEFADIFIKEIFSKHGLPTVIVSDRDPRFTSEFSKEFNRQMGIEQHMSTAFHPQSDGQIERMNRYVETILRGFVNPAQDYWDTLLPLVEFAINNSYQASIKNSPFFLNYGRHPTTPANVFLYLCEVCPPRARLPSFTRRSGMPRLASRTPSTSWPSMRTKSGAMFPSLSVTLCFCILRICA